MTLEGATPPLSISTDQVCAIVVMARAFDAGEEETDSDEGSTLGEDDAVAALDEFTPDATPEELRAAIDDLNFDQQVDLVALAWLGRDGGSLDDWATLRKQAADAHNERTAEYLLGVPLLPDYLEDALATFGRSCLDFERNRL